MDSSKTLSNNIWEKVFQKNADIVTRKIAGELFLVPIRGKMADMQNIYTLNNVGEYIWQELDHKKNLNDIREKIMSVFDVEKEQADSDLREFINDLLKADLIRE